MPDASLYEVCSASVGADNRVVPFNSLKLREGEQKHPVPSEGARFGFAGPANCVVSLNIPAEGPSGQEHPSVSFDIEFDPEQPDMVAINLLDLDDNNFIQTVQRSVSFPARLLAELLSRRVATEQEQAAWLMLDGEE